MLRAGARSLPARPVPGRVVPAPRGLGPFCVSVRALPSTALRPAVTWVECSLRRGATTPLSSFHLPTTHTHTHRPRLRHTRIHDVLAERLDAVAHCARSECRKRPCVSWPPRSRRATRTHIASRHRTILACAHPSLRHSSGPACRRRGWSSVYSWQATLRPACARIPRLPRPGACRYRWVGTNLGGSAVRTRPARPRPADTTGLRCHGPGGPGRDDLVKISRGKIDGPGPRNTCVSKPVLSPDKNGVGPL